MSIYTRTGDAGTTAVFGGKRISKSDTQIGAYGSVDELSSFIGLVVAKTKDSTEKKLLTKIQKALYEIMAALAGGPTDLGHLEADIGEFEKEIDKITKKLPELHRFILPQGGEIASLYHIARTVCRRAEREIVRYLQNSKLETRNSKLLIKYSNRMSDLFFTLARKHSVEQEIRT